MSMRIVDTAVRTATRSSVGPALRPMAVWQARDTDLRRGTFAELLGLGYVICVVLLAVWMAAAARLDATPAGVDLRTLQSPADLAPLLTSIAAPAERAAVAEALFRRAAADVALDRVGALAFVTLPAATLRDDGRFVSAARRAEGLEPTRPVRLLTSAQLAALKPLVVVRTRDQAVGAFARATALVLGSCLLAALYRAWRGRRDDPVILPAFCLLAGLGLMTMIALRDPLRDSLLAATFAQGVALGVAVLVAASAVDWESSPARRAVLLPLGAALTLALLLLVFGSGPSGSGVKVNLLGMQPVELIRLLVVFAVAGALARRFELLRALSEPAAAGRPWLAVLRLPRWRDVRPVVASMLLVLAFFFLQKDLGPALVLTGVVIALYAVARNRVAVVAVGLGMLALGFAIAYALGIPATVGQRVRIWLDPWSNGVPGGNHLAHGLWGMATGAWWGSGSLRATPQAIPEAHTDFVLAAIGEQLGFAGLTIVVALYALLAWRCLRVALRAPGEYSALLVLGVTMGLLVQGAVIAAGLLGLLPLTGVVTPFLSYGRSSMLANAAALGIVLGVARRAGPERASLRSPVRALAGVLAVLAILVTSRAAWVQVVHADALAAAPSLSLQGDGGFRYEYNPRLVAAAQEIERGTIVDRHGLPLATSRPSEMAALSARYGDAGLTAEPCGADASRCYPLGGAAFSVVGDWAAQRNWGARNASYLEREADAQLRGFDDRQRIVDVVHPRTGAVAQVARRDYSALLPLARHGAGSDRPAVQLVLDRPRDVRATLDARLQQRVAHALARGIVNGGHARGAAVVIDVESGDVLASVSYPWPSLSPSAQASDDDGVLDRVRYGLYPPGSTFKLLVAAATLRSRPHLESTAFSCQLLPGGRVGAAVRGWTRPVRDDVLDTVPHGDVDLRKGLVHSCNAYFAQLAMALGPAPLLDAAGLFQIAPAQPASDAALRRTLPHAGYGQGDVLASPLKMARVVAAIAGDGRVVPVRWTRDEAADVTTVPRLVGEPDARRLARHLRDAVTTGSGRALRGNPTAIAGKTGTAEVDGRRAHSWFIGFAPYGGPRPIAFAVLVEHAGYGGRAAAPIAGEIVDAARTLGYFRSSP